MEMRIQVTFAALRMYIKFVICMPIYKKKNMISFLNKKGLSSRHPISSSILGMNTSIIITLTPKQKTVKTRSRTKLCLINLGIRQRMISAASKTHIDTEKYRGFAKTLVCNMNNKMIIKQIQRKVRRKKINL